MFRIHPKPVPPRNYRTAWQNPRETQLIRSLVDYLYDHGFMMFHTGTVALSTATTETEIDKFVGTLRDGLAECF